MTLSDDRQGWSTTTPELDKLVSARETLGTEHIGAFLDWLRDDGCNIVRWEERPEEPCPYAALTFEALLDAPMLQVRNHVNLGAVAPEGEQP